VEPPPAAPRQHGVRPAVWCCSASNAQALPSLCDTGIQTHLSASLSVSALATSLRAPLAVRAISALACTRGRGQAAHRREEREVIVHRERVLGETRLKRHLARTLLMRWGGQ
jgi:hypothetical protein